MGTKEYLPKWRALVEAAKKTLQHLESVERNTVGYTEAAKQRDIPRLFDMLEITRIQGQHRTIDIRKALRDLGEDV